MATALCFYDSSSASSLASCYVVYKKTNADSVTLTLKNVNGVSNADLGTYISGLSSAAYDDIYIASACEASANSTATDTLNLANQFALRAKLKTASQGTLSALYENADTFSATTIGLTGAGFTANALVGAHAYVAAGTGSGQISEIKSNTIAVLTIWGTFHAIPDGTSDFRVITDMHMYLVGSAHLGISPVELAWDALYPSNTIPYALAVLGGYPLYKIYTSTATGINATTLTNSAASYVTNAYVGKYVMIYAATTNGFQFAKITSNDGTVLTFTGGWDRGLTPTGTPVYAIVDSLADVFRDLYMKYYSLTYGADLTDGDCLDYWARLVDIRDITLRPASTAPIQDLDFLLNTVFVEGKIMFEALRLGITA